MLITPAPPAPPAAPPAPPAPTPFRRWAAPADEGSTPRTEAARSVPAEPVRRKRGILCAVLVMVGMGLVGPHGLLGTDRMPGARGAGFPIGHGPPSPPVASVGRGAVAVSTAIPGVARGKALPTGKGMWIYEFPQTEGGNVDAIVARAKATGITHVYPRLGSHWDGFNAKPYLDAFLPAAHAGGLLVFGWDFPRLGDSLESDLDRARAMITYTTPSGDRFDGFSADIETINEGSHVTPDVALVYGQGLREIAGPDFTLIATVPRPSPRNRPDYPYPEIVESFDAIAPMTYWLNRQPDTDVIGAIDELAKFGKPIFPVGQAYDGGPEGGRPGVPPPEELQGFMKAALDKGALGVSFWSWQAADEAAWTAIRDASEFRAPDQPPL